MTAEEMDNEFDVLYNNITSNQAPGLNAYEKSIFLTKAQDEILKNYFNPKSKGNLTQEGFDSNQKRQIDFSSLMYSYSTSNVQEDGTFDTRDGVKSVILPKNILFIVNEFVEVTRSNKDIKLQVIPISFEEYTRLMSKPYKRPLKYQAWKLITNYPTAGGISADIIVGPADKINEYSMRYVKKPNPIIVDNLEDLAINTESNTKDCELDPILHEEIVQRAVELAKAAWTSTGQDNLQAIAQMGQRSE